MKNVLLLFCIVLTGCIHWNHHEQMTPHWTTACATITHFVVNGTYQGKNLYVQNPQITCQDSVQRFVSVSVTINDTISIPADSLQSFAFEIPLTKYGFKMNDAVHIDIAHYADGLPKLLNPEVR